MHGPAGVTCGVQSTLTDMIDAAGNLVYNNAGCFDPGRSAACLVQHGAEYTVTPYAWVMARRKAGQNYTSKA
jgi:hypothetical protein